ncbi:hypothetical protein N0V84_000605 [Fusarium piperis]|uniref:Uncharacterized protein n=1 Tax=Fusarium piperis TaxID=1435070 RepID=A0A9W9BTQ6_9HYPO|nr:hypothetical protein N0V84_000605 [Fusarium piperis]
MDQPIVPNSKNAADQVNLDLTEDASIMRFPKVPETKTAGPSDVGSMTDLAHNEIWTESGYGSWGKNTAPTSVGDSFPKQQPTEFDPHQQYSDDEDDVATVYSVAASVPEDDLETYKSELSEALSKAIHPHIPDEEQRESLASLLPTLLQSFALRLGCPGSSKVEKEIMYFVHKHRNGIAGRFDDTIKNTGDEEDLTSLATEQNEAPVGWNVDWWAQGVSQSEATGQDMAHPYDSGSKEVSYPDLERTDPKPSKEKEEQPLKEKEERVSKEEEEQLSKEEEEEQPSKEEEEQPSLLDQRGYRDAIFNSVAYSWLTAALVKTLTMAPVGGEDICASLHDKIHASLGRKRNVSSHSPSKRHDMVFALEWDPKLFLREQFPDETDMRRLFRQVLTLTGSVTDAQILPCADYVLQTWPTTGPTILELLEDALVTGNEASIVFLTTLNSRSKSRELQTLLPQWASRSSGLEHLYVHPAQNQVLQLAVRESKYLGQQRQVLRQNVTSSSVLKNTLLARKSLVPANAGTKSFEIL